MLHVQQALLPLRQREQCLRSQRLEGYRKLHHDVAVSLKRTPHLRLMLSRRRADGDGINALDEVIKPDLWSLKLVRKPTSADRSEGRTWIQSDRSGASAPSTADANDPPAHQL